MSQPARVLGTTFNGHQPSDELLPCAVCGRAAPSPADASLVVRRRVLASGPMGRLSDTADRDTTVTFTHCENCAPLLRRARTLAHARRDLARRLGATNEEQAAELFLGVLVGLDRLGRTMPTNDAPAVELARLVRHLSATGRAARFSAQASSAANDKPWQHLTGDQSDALASGYAAVLNERLHAADPPRPVPVPPIEHPYRGMVQVTGGCLFCGVSSVIGTWRPVNAPIQGHLCPTCAEALRQEGAMGKGAVARAYVRHLEATGDPRAARLKAVDGEGRQQPVSGLRSFSDISSAAQRAGLPPIPGNAEPWQHLER